MSLAGAVVGGATLSMLSGCAAAPSSPDEDPIVMTPESAKARSVELQHEVLEVMPKEYFTENDLPGIDSGTTHRLLKCAPILDEQYAKSDTKLVQYPGMFAVNLNVGVPLEKAAEETYRAAARELGAPGTNVEAEANDFYYPPIKTEDGYSIIISFTEVGDSPKDNIVVDVWSPCFIPEGGTLPPGRKI